MSLCLQELEANLKDILDEWCYVLRGASLLLEGRVKEIALVISEINIMQIRVVETISDVRSLLQDRSVSHKHVASDVTLTSTGIFIWTPAS